MSSVQFRTHYYKRSDYVIVRTLGCSIIDFCVGQAVLYNKIDYDNIVMSLLIAVLVSKIRNHSIRAEGVSYL